MLGRLDEAVKLTKQGRFYLGPPLPDPREHGPSPHYGLCRCGAPMGFKARPPFVVQRCTATGFWRVT